MIDLLADPKCTDIAWSWILVLFGTEGTSCTIVGAANTNSPYANAFAVLTSALAFLGSLFMAFHVVVGIVSSAKDGKVLGERWHQIWAPLRIVFGFGLLIPVGGGFSSIHYILRDAVGVAAVQLGNGVINTYVATAFKDAAASTARVATLAGKDYADKFFEKEVCAGVISTATSSMFTIFPYEAASPAKGEPVSFADKLTSAGSATGFTWNYGDCGVLSLKDMTVDKIDNGFFSTSDENNGILSADMAGRLLETFNKERYAATEKLFNSIKGLAGTNDGTTGYQKLGKAIDVNLDSVESSSAAMIRKFRTDGTVPVGIQDKLDAAAAQWDKDVSDAASKIFQSMTDGARSGALNHLPDYGFMVAGGYERSLSALSGMISGISNTTMGGTVPDFDEDTSKKVNFAKSVMVSSRAVDNPGDGSSSADGNSDAATGILASIIPSNLYNMYNAKVSADPVGDMIMFGNNLLALATYSLLALGAVKVGAAVAGGNFLASASGLGAGLGVLVDYLSNWISWLITIMILVGLMHSFVLPMLPMIMIFTMGVSWLIMFLEGAVAGVLWAFVFIRMDGQEFFDQKQSPGVGLLFNLLLRPALGMLAFCGMLVLLPALLNALNQVWLTAFSLQSGNHGLSVVALWQWVAQLVMFCWMQWTLTLRITGLIPTIADRVGHWMGISSTSGYGDSQETTAHVGAMIAASQALGRAPIGGGGGGRPRGGGGGGGGGGDIPRGNPEANRSSQGKNGGNKFKK
ncbi:DotA/TraY family protein [Rhizobium laguerreae]|uniref:DotA/TraY family protein n=1 Tax=Rhizobium laguerreae TaxID=1076926 RepID=UPI001C90CF50|nr:DotA/TraY family protein [Rhizobium laguerreae]MBY3151219.1 DotA/TraY family protein [Rhizobium laguerreae]